MQWYYTQNGSQCGPVDDDELQRLAQAGSLTADDLVWNASMPEWVAAGRITSLVFPTRFDPTPPAAAPGYAGATGPLAYEAPGPEVVQVTHRTVEILQQTRPWVMFMAVLMFIGVGMMLLGAFSMVLVGTVISGGRKAGSPALMLGLAAIYLVLAVIFIGPPILLTRYFRRIGTVSTMRRAVDLEGALEAQKAYWKYISITTIAVVVLYVIGIVGVVIFR